MANRHPQPSMAWRHRQSDLLVLCGFTSIDPAQFVLCARWFNPSSNHHIPYLPRATNPTLPTLTGKIRCHSRVILSSLLKFHFYVFPRQNQCNIHSRNPYAIIPSEFFLSDSLELIQCKLRTSFIQCLPSCSLIIQK